MQIPALTAIKASFIFFYRRIFMTGQEKLFPWISAVTLATILIWGLGYFFGFLLICPGHPSAYWTKLSVQKEHCVNTGMLHTAYGISDVILDIVVILLPIPWVRSPLYRVSTMYS